MGSQRVGYSPCEMLQRRKAQMDNVKKLEVHRKAEAHPNHVNESLIGSGKATRLGKADISIVRTVCCILDASNPKNVLVRRLVLVVEGRPDVVMDLCK